MVYLPTTGHRQTYAKDGRNLQEPFIGSLSLVPSFPSFAAALGLSSESISGFFLGFGMTPFTPSHPFAEIFPLHDTGEWFDAFVADLKANGLREPILLYEGKVLDGRRRERGCRRAGIEPKYKEFKGDDNAALELVVSKNLHRRHLGDGEKALCAGRYATAKLGTNQHGRVCQFDKSEETPTRSDAAEMFGVNETTVDRGKKVAVNGTPALQEAVMDGTLSLSDAASVAGESAKKQNEAVQSVKDGKTRTAKAATQKKQPGKPTFDDRTVIETIRKLTRLLDERAKAFGKCKEHDDCISAMNNLLTKFERWQKK